MNNSGLMMIALVGVDASKGFSKTREDCIPKQAVVRRTGFLFILCAALLACNSQDCSQIPSNFKSYQRAISFIKTATFKVKDNVNTSKSSWIKSAFFYSCDGRTGYLILKTGAKEYIHSAVPYVLWNQFKNASSFGSFYNKNIKGKYRFNL